MKFLALLAIGLVTQAADPVLLKTGPEILASYAAVTGIDPSDPDIHGLYLSDVKRFPKQGTPDEMSNNMILAAIELGGEFCLKELAEEQGEPGSQRTLFGNVDFTSGPSQFDDYASGALFENLALAFWQRDVTDAEKQALKTIMTNSVQGDTPDQTVAAMQIICTVYGSSLAFLVK